MFVVVSYDIGNTEKAAGARRLRRVAKICQNFGQRVQFSVFECNVRDTQWAEMKMGLLEAVDLKFDSLRFYMLGNQPNRIEHYSVKPALDFESTLII
jgi:CRISPR-associated protein Cas2